LECKIVLFIRPAKPELPHSGHSARIGLLFNLVQQCFSVLLCLFGSGIFCTGDVKNVLLKNKMDYLLVTAPENVAWILNIRGYDSAFSPIPNARLLVNSKGDIDLFSEPKKVKKIKKIFSKKSQIH